ncbi:type II toxin-antitoxin system RelE family toxin [Acinetobacter pittii]|uniref:type II toxin-antitoxin system RelE family toxin n=1 Tax=Acinetobacter pittii TaxID=48296 RepID=UPI0021CDA84A|nr:type II toxin-antitoxin system RelE/ParE family toxin [Acinetobacter pittii]MCU4346099.1 type II toxin-antitoxin system RelE/ParE family toxin [Acinetobacter pittii]MCU4356528.1 type II toxin-antitoxin system RelE/ParE family toxin [Acinetobacter pittii]
MLSIILSRITKVIEQPHIPKNMLRGDLTGCYKIKLLKTGVRLVYQVKDDQVVILLITVGKRADSIVYDEAKKRIKD